MDRFALFTLKGACMHKEMRRKDRLLSEQETLAILEKGQFGTLATVTAAGEPYAVPLSYVLWNGEVIFHCAPMGEKVDNIEKNPTACFSVVLSQEPTAEGGYSVYYESCTLFGRVRKITDEKEFRDALVALTTKYFPNNLDIFDSEFDSQVKRTSVYAIVVDRMTGKRKPKP